MRLGPPIPLYLDLVSGLDRRVGFGRLAVAVADDVGVRVVGRRHEAIVNGACRPADAVADGIGSMGIEASVLLSVDDEVQDAGVGEGLGEQGAGRQKSQ